VYVHIPFCAKLCPYCDFAVAVRREIPHESYADAVLSELSARAGEGLFDGRHVTSVYFGGGTPTLLAPEQVARLVEQISEQVGDAVEEWAFEANPLDLTPATASAWRGLGFGRVSMGVQSFDDAYLARLGRQHRGEDARRAIEVAFDAGFDVSFDLIFAGPQHDLETWRSDLEVVRGLERVDHVSAYHLTVEPQTVFARQHASGDLELPDDEVAVVMLEELRDTCAARGVEQYEVSSYAAPGKRSVHNSHYWCGSEYVGLGVGAHGLKIADVVTRTSNTRALRAYLADPVGTQEHERIGPLTHLGERAFTGLRSAWGLDFAELYEQFAGAVADEAFVRLERALDRVVAQGWAVRNGEHYRPSEEGFLFADLAGEWVFDAAVG
jgi:oxygen-independent coproporphyrinogen-3 oxidase